MSFDMYANPHNMKVEIQIGKLALTQHTAIRKAFYFIGKDLVKDVNKEILKLPKHGRIYRLRLRGRTVIHQASAAGEAPANFTGSLRSSIDFDVVGSDKMIFGSKDKFQNRKGTPSGVIYGKALELGDKSRNLKARPFLLPTIKKNYRNIQNHFERELKKDLEKTPS